MMGVQKLSMIHCLAKKEAHPALSYISYFHIPRLWTIELLYFWQIENPRLVHQISSPMEENELLRIYKEKILMIDSHS